MPPTSLLSVPALRSLVLVAALAVGLVAAMAALPLVVHLETGAWLAASAASAAMVRWTAALASRRPGDRTGAFARCLAWGLAMGVLNVGVAFCAAAMVGPDPSLRSLVLAPFAMLVGAPSGLILGAAFGAALSIPVGVLLLAWRRGTPHATDEATAVVGVWAAGLVLALALVPEPVSAPPFSPWSSAEHPALDPLQRGWLRGASLIIGLGGLGLAALALGRIAQRRRFVQEVADGRRPGWRIDLPASPIGMVALPSLGGRPDEHGQALLRVELAGEGVYRRAEASWPVALVPSRWVSK
ncbi:MAG: hypothetical protein AB1Z98_30595 [Nannocystaceae bacterium]